jgi:hypothetical protein
LIIRKRRNEGVKGGMRRNEEVEDLANFLLWRSGKSK